jgi:hypothetical protein
LTTFCFDTSLKYPSPSCGSRSVSPLLPFITAG